MVFLTVIRYNSRKIKRTFVDNVRVYARGGGGGQGLPRYGGQGGRGGHVYVKAESGTRLRDILRHAKGRRYIAESGQNSKSFMLQGAPGKDMEIPVPSGVEVINDAGRILGELNAEGDRLLVARGGAGGGPSNVFIGQRADAVNLRLDLKLIADVGLVGFPNAGKSTFLSAISRSSPKIASYPFTTIQPQVGVMSYPDGRQVSVADLPGLIEGAHLNVGMGHRFLKHVERTKMLLFVVDLHGFNLGPRHPTRTAIETALLLNKELELYKPELLSKPSMLLLNKVDVENPDIDLADITHHMKHLSTTTLHSLPPDLLPQHFLTFENVMCISAKERTMIDQVQERVRSLLDLYADLARGIEPSAHSQTQLESPAGPLLI